MAQPTVDERLRTLPAHRRILVVSWGLLGDTIMATPALRALRAGLPEAHLAFSCHASWAPLFDDRSVTDEIVPVRPKTWKGLGGLLWRRPADLTRLAAPGWDIVLDLGGGANVMRLVRRVAPVVAISTRSDPRPPYDCVTDAAIRHGCDRYLSVAAQVGGVGTDRRYHLARIQPDQTPWPLGEGSRILINPGASIPAKRWPAERFAAVATALRQQGCRVVVVWGPDERELAASICAASGASLAPPTSPLGLAQVLAAADVCLTGDSGPMHLAAGLNVKVLALFSTADPEIYAPPGRVDMICHGGPIDTGGPAVETVLAATLRIMLSR